jgi:hypothetical protein
MAPTRNVTVTISLRQATSVARDRVEEFEVRNLQIVLPN